MNKKKIYFLISFWTTTLVASSVQAQSAKDLTYYSIETGATASSGQNTPFWLVANRYGLSSIRKNNAYLAAGIFRKTDKERPFSYAFGLELAGLSRFTSYYVVQQAYIDLNFRGIELSLGSKERGNEMKNDLLSMGGMTFSTNARPIPQGRISIPEYLPVPGTHRWIHIKGHVAYGVLTDDRFQRHFTGQKAKYSQKVLYHSKAAFLKVGNDKFPFFAELGVEMAAQFGGDCYYPNGTVIRTPRKWTDFLRVFFPGNGDSGASESDRINILGNHVGSYSMAMGYRFPTWKLKGYYEHFFEDRSGMTLTYGMWKDCLVGLEATLPNNPVASTVVAEYLYTKHQSGAFHYFGSGKIDETFTGADNYYNNSQYSGWEHWGQAIGNPILISPIYNKNGSLSFRSNRVKAFHLGISGEPTPEISYRILMTLAKHWGTYSVPFRHIQRNKNGLLEVSYQPEKWKGWQFTVAGAIDGGDLIGDSFGGMLTIRKTGIIGRRGK